VWDGDPPGGDMLPGGISDEPAHLFCRYQGGTAAGKTTEGENAQ
jgi:hypothetical protein